MVPATTVITGAILTFGYLAGPSALFVGLLTLAMVVAWRSLWSP